MRSGFKLAGIAAVFTKLGFISFGGPVAHIGYLRGEFVARRRWLDEAAFADLVALCQFLPGPASSQLVFALGMRRAGLPGAVLASAGFTAPAALLMILFAYGVREVGNLNAEGWLHGLKIAAVAVVAQAVWSMGRKLCPDRARIALALLAAAGVLLAPGTLGQIGVIVAGGIVGWWLYRHQSVAGAGPAAGWARHHGWAASALVLFGVLLLVLPALAAATGSRELAVVDSFYRAGSLVFGGGHVILPLLRAEVVPPGWVADDVFLAGYGAAQAVPGPLFTLAAYLGTMIHAGPGAWGYGVMCLAAIFLPAWLLIGGALPFWQLLRCRPWAQAAMNGTNAAVVGVLLAAFYDPVWREGVTGPVEFGVALGALVLLATGRVPVWLVVPLAAAAGQWLL